MVKQVLFLIIGFQSTMKNITTPNIIGNQLRILRIILVRFGKAAGVLITVPVVQYNGASQTVKITVGYITNGIGTSRSNLH